MPALRTSRLVLALAASLAASLVLAGPAAAGPLDTTAPDAPTVTSPVNSGISQATVPFTATGEEGATLLCSLDDAEYVECPKEAPAPGGKTNLTVGWDTVIHWGEPSNYQAFYWGFAEGLSKNWYSYKPASSFPSGVTLGAMWRAFPSNFSYGTSCEDFVSKYQTGLGKKFLIGEKDNGFMPNPSYYNTFTVDCADTTAEVPAGGSARFSALSEGEHTLSVKQVDAGGNESDVTTTTWTADPVAPDAPVLSGAPYSLTKSRSANIGFSGEANATFTCSVDGGAYEACSSPKSLSNLSDGAHSLSVKAADAAGNESPAATATWTVDNTAPAIPVISGAPSGLTTSNSASITFTSDVDATSVCKVDDGYWRTCTSPQTLTDLSDGPHRFSVKATDSLLNISGTATAEWTVDATAPAAPALSGVPGDPTASTSATINFTGEDGASFICSLDGGEYAGCSPPVSDGHSQVTLTGLAFGDHTFRVKQTDAAGNVSELVSAEWTVVAPNAPLLLSQVGLSFNKKTRVTTLKLNAAADTRVAGNSIKWIEYFSREKRPAANAPQNPKKIRRYATTVVLPAKEVAFWVRFKDTNLKWSGWYSTKK